jgi:plastocyanin
VTWTFGTAQTPLSVAPGDTVTFQFASGHNVEEFPDATAYGACDFASATLLSAGNTGPYVWTAPDTAGVHHFGCSVGTHCATGNMKIEVTVAP